MKEKIRNGSIMDEDLFNVLIKGEDYNLKFEDMMEVCKILTGWMFEVNTVYPSVRTSLENARMQLEDLNNLTDTKKDEIMKKFYSDGEGKDETKRTVRDFYDTFSGVIVESRKKKAESLITDVDELNSVTALQIELNDMRRIIENLNFEINRLTEEKNKAINEKNKLLLIMYPPPPSQPTTITNKPAQPNKPKNVVNTGKTSGLDDDDDDDVKLEEKEEEIKVNEEEKEEIKVKEEEIKVEIKEEEEKEKDNWLKTLTLIKEKKIYNNSNIPTCFRLSKVGMKVNLNDITKSIEKKTNDAILLTDEYFCAVCNSSSTSST